MSYWIHEAGNKNNSLWRFFMCDSLLDLKNLTTATKEGQIQPNDTVCKNRCCPGSQCFCLEDGSVWFLGKDTDKWIQRKDIPFEGSSENNAAPISFSSIQSLFP